MASNTTTTTTTDQHWVLEKYSRSRAPVERPVERPVKRLKLGERGREARTNEGEETVAWDHYTQPQLSLRLRTTYSATSSSSSSQHVLSMLLSISFDPLFRESNRAKQHLTLDLLDLASFSSPAIRAASPPDQLPLKAVYKDAVLGIRYIGLEGEEGTFKRLQVKFTSVAERERFVNAVGAFVPSKPAVDPKKVHTTPSKGVEGGVKQARTPTPKKKKQPGSAARAPPPVSTDPFTFPSSSVAHPPQSTSMAKQTTNALNVDRHPPPRHSSSSTILPASAPPASPRLPTPATSGRSDTSTLPRNLTSLLPNLASASESLPPLPLPTTTPSEQLNQLSPTEFDSLLQEALLEDGFEELVAKVQATLMG